MPFHLICDFPSIFAQPSYTAMRRAAILGSAAAFQPPPTDTSTHSHSLFNPAPPENGLIGVKQTSAALPCHIGQLPGQIECILHARVHALSANRDVFVACVARDENRPLTERIAVHCRGGLGRTGTVAGLLLVEFGDKPKTAVKTIRAVRPGSIETTDQEKFIENCKPIAFARAQRSQEERVLASLLGGAVGDALGYAVEFKKLDEIREIFGEGGIKEPILRHTGARYRIYRYICPVRTVTTLDDLFLPH